MEIVTSMGSAGWSLCMRIGCLEVHIYVKSTLGMLRREGCVPASCARRYLLTWAVVCEGALCFVGGQRAAVLLSTAFVPEPTYTEVLPAHL